MSPRRKRPAWVAWIPAAILLIAIVGVGVTASLLIRTGLGTPAPQPTDGQVTDLNWSLFTPDGLAYVERSRLVRVDLSQPPVDAAELGLERDGELVVGPFDSGDVQLDVDLIVRGTGETPTGEKFRFATLSVVTTDGELTSIRGIDPGYANFRTTLDRLLAEAPEYGWDTSAVDAIFAQVEAATRAGEPYTFTFGPGTALGVAISATATCDTSGFCGLEYEVAPSMG